MEGKIELNLNLKFPDDENDICNKYFEPAQVKMQTGDYKSALKMLDKGLKLKPESIGFRTLKAYLFYLLAKELFDDLNESVLNSPNSDINSLLEMGRTVDKNSKKIMKFLEESVNLLDNILSESKENENGTEKMLKAIENYSKDVRKIIDSLLKSYHELDNDVSNLSVKCDLICPYCESSYERNFGLLRENKQKDEFIEKCPECSKDYLVIKGKVTLFKSRGTGVVSFGQSQYIFRIKNNNGEKPVIFNSNANLLHVKTGDNIIFIFKKGRLSSKFSYNPSLIMDETSMTCTFT